MKVKNMQKTNILKNCLNISEELNDKKLVNVFFKLSSKISINKSIENKKYNPPIHWDEDLQIMRLSSRCFILSNIVKPVEVNPDIASKYASIKVIL